MNTKGMGKERETPLKQGEKRKALILRLSASTDESGKGIFNFPLGQKKLTKA